MAGQGASEPAVFTELEVEFMAEDESINIVPNVRMDTLHMICGDYGPFRPQIPVTVPLWLGIAMKKRSKCRIQPPNWMSVERLTEVLEMEREAPREFQPLPFHYVEIAKLLLDNAREDFENNYMVQSLLEDIKDVRWDKVEKGLKTLSGRTHAVKLKNLSAMEVNRMRAFTVRALQSFFKHDNDDMTKQAPADSDSQPTPASSDRLPRVCTEDHPCLSLSVEWTLYFTTCLSVYINFSRVWTIDYVSRSKPGINFWYEKQTLSWMMFDRLALRSLYSV